MVDNLDIRLWSFSQAHQKEPKREDVTYGGWTKSRSMKTSRLVAGRRAEAWRRHVWWLDEEPKHEDEAWRCPTEAVSECLRGLVHKISFMPEISCCPWWGLGLINNLTMTQTSNTSVDWSRWMPHQRSNQHSAKACETRRNSPRLAETRRGSRLNSLPMTEASNFKFRCNFKHYIASHSMILMTSP